MTGLIVFCAAGVFAQSNDEESHGKGSTSISTTENTDQIKPDELPDAVKKSLDSPKFKGWIINAVHYDEKKKRYEVQLKNGADTKTVKFTSDGNVVD